MKNIGVGLLVMLIAAMLCAAPVSAAQRTDIAVIDFANDNAVAEENLSVSGYGDKDSGYATSIGGARVYASVSGTDLRKLEWSKGEYGTEGMQPVMTGGTKNPWGKGAYIEVRIPTTGYKDIAFSASIGSTNKGPRDYHLQYSTDGKTFHDVAGATFTVTTNKTLYAAFNEVALPAETANCALLYVRIAVASNILVNGTAGLIGSASGETAINHVKVSGTPIATTAAPTTSSTAEGGSTSASAAASTAVNGSTAASSAGASATTTVAAKATAAASPSAKTADVSHAAIAFAVACGSAAVLLLAAKSKMRRAG